MLELRGIVEGITCTGADTFLFGMTVGVAARMVCTGVAVAMIGISGDKVEFAMPIGLGDTEGEALALVAIVKMPLGAGVDVALPGA